MTAKTPLELLSPCRSAEIGKQAILHGADAVYIGGPLFSARANAGNTLEEIASLTEFAHRYRARVYMALNTILTDRELEPATKLAHDAYNIGVDALIVQDMGLLMCDLPPIQLHASTQCDIRTPEKAKFLESVGFSQIVPARELDLEQIKAIRDSLTSARIEFFIHGALCVSYSGQCYASQVLKGRSANRGECAQICRLPFDVYDSEGMPIARQSHVLSLKDNNQTDNLAALIEAGVRSFKIEGRYKDVTYVKSTTAHYRRLIDRYIESHPEFELESIGRVELNFEPDVNNAFNRGSTDYFVNGRHGQIAALNSPKNTGDTVGTITRLTDRFIQVRSRHDFNNGDGLTFWKENAELGGFLVNKAERDSNSDQLWNLYTRENTERIPGLRIGLELMRNKDSAWLKKMNAETALRKIPIRLEAKVSQNAVRLTVEDTEGNRVQTEENGEFADAENPQRALEQLRTGLNKLGNTIYIADDTKLDEESVKFLPVSLINRLRRSAIEKLDALRAERFETLKQACADPSVQAPISTVDYHANVFNAKAVEFYRKHGITVTEDAVETGTAKKTEVELMRCKHCIRYALNMCPKQGAQRGEKIKPFPLKIVSGKIELLARFHCKPCEMSIIKFKPLEN